MKKIPVTEITEGQVLARDVFDDSDRVLLGAGTVLGEKHIKILERRNIIEVAIKTPDDNPPGTDAVAGEKEPPKLTAKEEERRKAQIRRIDHMFELVADEHPRMQTLRKLVLERSAKGLLHD